MDFKNMRHYLIIFLGLLIAITVSNHANASDYDDMLFDNLAKKAKPVLIDNAETDTKDSIEIEYPIPQDYIPQEIPSSKNFDISTQIENYEDSVDDLIRNAYNASVVGHHEAALTYYLAADKKQPNNPNTLFAIATLHHKLHQFTDAKKYYKKLLNIDREYPKAVDNYLHLVSEQNPEYAIREYIEIININPNNHEVLEKIGLLYFKLDNIKKAADFFLKAVVAAPNNAKYRYNLAICYDRLAAYPQAIKLYESIIQLQRSPNIDINTQLIHNRIRYLNSKLN